MFHRIYAKPFTRVNEAWNVDNQIDSSPSDPYKDTLISGISNNHKINHDLYCEFYKNFALDIVTETVYNYPYTQITEKTIRPIVHKKMFIIVGAPGILALLKSKGFKTFTPFIDEHYDTIQDPHQRIKCIIDELARISEFSIDYMQKTMLQYKETLQHNYDQYHWLCKNEIEQVVNKL